jgi:GNAT superfamily N-acetyltransferase
MQTGAAPVRFTPFVLDDLKYTRSMSPMDAETSLFEVVELTTGHPDLLIAGAREMLLEYGRFVISQPGVARFCFGTLEKEAERLPLSYFEQGGGCLAATVSGQPAGFVAWRTVPASVATDAWELKRLWVRPLGRGLGLGRALTQAVLDRAVAAGRTAVYLDTVPQAMPAAHRLYLQLGFVPCDAYNDNPVDGLAYLVKYL